MSNNTINIQTLSAGQEQEWDDYVNHHPDGTFFHLSGWQKVIAQAYGHDTCYLMAKADNAVVGVLPLGHIKSRLFGNALISNPFCAYGGVIADTGDICNKLETAAEQEALKRNVDYLELRNIKQRRDDWPIKELYVTFRKEIDPNPEINMKAIPRKQRAMVRKGIKAGLVSEIDSGIDRFFDVYAVSVRNLGTPVFSKRYFRILKEVFGDKCEPLTVYKDRRPVSSVISFYFRDQVLPYYGGGTPEARILKGFDFMYWELMRRASEKGIHIFDYGRSKIGTGSYSFKKNWGFEPEPLQYQYRLVRADTIPNINPLNPKYRLFVNLWKRLPLPIANMLGPLLSRSLG